MSRPIRAFVASPAFVFRTPLLPIETLLRWSEGLQAPSADAPADAIAADRARLRSRLRELVDQSWMRDALYVASPDLDSSLATWHSDPDSEGGQKVERALVRYFTRMSSRPTPFGLFSGVSVGEVADATDLLLAPQAEYERHSRVDNEYLFALAERLADDPQLRETLRYRTNTSAHVSAGRVRWAEPRMRGNSRTYQLVAADASEPLLATLSRCRDGASRAALAAALEDDDPELEAGEAAAFVDELVDSRLLEPDLMPCVTGVPPLDDLVGRLREHPCAASIATTLSSVREDLRALDDDGLGAPRARYEAIADRLGGLPIAPHPSGCLQVDLAKPSPSARIGGAPLREIERGVELLARMSPRRSQLQAFQDAFVERYEERELLLVEALDDESGIGFGTRNEVAAETSPLLDGVSFPSAPGAAPVPWGGRERVLLEHLERTWRTGARELELSDADIERLSVTPHARLPDAFVVTAQIAARSPEALARGEFRVLVEAAHGPSGARLLGRFCHPSPRVRAAVGEHLRQEEALAPHAIFAEVAYLPEGRLGNVACRPLLRAYEIPYLGASGVARDHQIPVDDLMISVRDGRIVLRSRRLDREVIPRNTNAHAFATHGFGAYRFLCMLQDQHCDPAVFSWGPFEDAPFLPRVTHGRLVLDRARWRIGTPELRRLAAASKGAVGNEAARRRFLAVQSLRCERGLPRYVLVADRDHELFVDFDNTLSVDSFVHLVKSRPHCMLEEVFPAPDELAARGPEGTYRHELVLPFVRSAVPTPPPSAPTPTVIGARRFAAGSSWSYAKIYTGTAGADEVLRRFVAPIARDAITSGAADAWFFVRYRDPHWHLRVRFHGDPERLRAEVGERLAQHLRVALEDGLVWRVQHDTYEREVERYGGIRGVELAERLFWRDSESVVDVLDELWGEADTDARWKLALRGTDRLFDDLGLSLAAKHAIATRARANLAAEQGVGVEFGRQVGTRFRRERDALVRLLQDDDGGDALLGAGLAHLRERSRRLAPIVAELRDADRARTLSRPLADMAWCYAHMHDNRMLRAAHRAQELVIYDLLRRCYESALARVAHVFGGAPPPTTALDGTD